MLARINAISDPSKVADPSYSEGLRAAVAAALDYGLLAVDCSGDQEAPIPVELLAQARHAADAGVSLDTVLRRYLAGYSVLNDLLVSETEQAREVRPSELKLTLRVLAARLDHLLSAVSDEYARACEHRLRSSEQQRVESLRRLLAGELLDTSEIPYDFDARHVGVIAMGADAEAELRRLVEPLDTQLLLTKPAGLTVWAWLGHRRPIDVDELLSRLRSRHPCGAAVALGESALGLCGWRLTHRQAGAALRVALRTAEPVARYADVVLLASVIQDDLHVTSLNQLYLTPLEEDRDGGATARQTLRAYFAAECNVSSTAMALHVSRNTVRSRLRAVEARLGRPIASMTTDLDVALRLHELDEYAKTSAQSGDITTRK